MNSTCLPSPGAASAPPAGLLSEALVYAVLFGLNALPISPLMLHTATPTGSLSAPATCSNDGLPIGTGVTARITRDSNCSTARRDRHAARETRLVENMGDS